MTIGASASRWNRVVPANQRSEAMFNDDTWRNMSIQLRLLRNKSGPWWAGLVLLGAVVAIGLGTYTYVSATSKPDAPSPTEIMTRVKALEIVTLEDYLRFLDTNKRSFAYRRYQTELIVTHAVPSEGGMPSLQQPKLYRIDYSDRTIEEAEKLLAARLPKER